MPPLTHASARADCVWAVLRPVSIVASVLALALVLAGCGALPGGDSAKEKSSDDKPASSKVKEGGPLPGGVLVLNGRPVDANGRRLDTGERPSSRDGRKAADDGTTVERDDRTLVRTFLAPPLMTDGTIDDGADPFDDGSIPLHPLPLENDPATTRDVDAFAQGLREVPGDLWRQWLDDGSPAGMTTGPADVVNAMVRIYVKKCGGAQYVASGVVLADETVVTTVHAVESPMRRVRVEPLGSPGLRTPAMIQYVDVDDDVAVLRVPGLQMTPLGMHAPQGTDPARALGFGVGVGGSPHGVLRRIPVFAARQEQSITLEQPDGFDQAISDRSVFPVAGAVSNGFSGGVIAATNDDDLVDGWGFHGLVRARVPFRSRGGGIAVPARVVRQAIDASNELDEWFELRPTGCPQWHRARTS